jgi:HEAT repeat protein
MRRLLIVSLMVLLAGCGKAKKKDYSLEELLQKLKDNNPGTRYWAARELGHRGPQAKDAVPALTEALKDRDTNVRMGGAYALGEIGPDAKAAVPALQRALNDPAQGVRKGAAYALRQIQEPAASAKEGKKPGQYRPRRDPRKQS